ncbi:protein CapI [Saccharobesus litoralis]|uniref:Protein CapI n=1 Tax=Saccharobesus litoralis TaxID=2172099 RepID=A0A2S0VRJ4_9ALTE|nr:NAD-dependent epimerase [Saccharobesus litoralis]AWB66845.1 protein CapI [Saccharobesus litoralis]
MKYLVTGAAGFIGFHCAQQLLKQGHQVVGIDNLNNYYPVTLKESRLAQLKSFDSFVFIKLDIADRDAMADLFAEQRFDIVIHLAAQAGVRYSIDNPYAYADANLLGHLAILEGCRHTQVKHLVYASSSSVYGLNDSLPFSTADRVDKPVSFYAATKRSNELMAHTYAHLFAIPISGLRFFTVYGPWGRPDMALFKFTKAILNGQPIDIYNEGNLARDFTYIDDIVEGVLRVASHIPNKETGHELYRLYNIGNGSPVKLLDFVNAIEQALDKQAIKNLMPMQAGDVYRTWADTSQLAQELNYKPSMDLQTGVAKFVDWYRDYYQA